MPDNHRSPDTWLQPGAAFSGIHTHGRSRNGLGRSVRLTLIVAWLALSAAGCSTTLGSARDAYDQARYAEAIALYRTVDDRSLDRRQRARWHLYAGLSELSLGNLGRAIWQLTRARCALERDSTALDETERGRLEAAWMSIGRMPSERLYENSNNEPSSAANRCL